MESLPYTLTKWKRVKMIERRVRVIPQREEEYFYVDGLEFDTENLILNGFDKIIYTKNKRPLNFEIRFHLMPDLKVTKTIDGQNILFEVENSGWKLSCENNKIDFETGLYFGNKNKYVENKNIFIYGNTNNENKMIHWILQKI